MEEFEKCLEEGTQKEGYASGTGAGCCWVVGDTDKNSGGRQPQAGKKERSRRSLKGPSTVWMNKKKDRLSRTQRR